MMMWWLKSVLFSFRSPLHRACSVLIGLFAMQIAVGARARIVINEVYYDHPGRDDGWEFIELYNAGTYHRDISGLRLEFLDGRTGAARPLWNAPDGIVLEPGGIVLVAGDSRLSDPAFMLNNSLENGPDAVRLVDSDGVVDLVGYGDVTMPGLYESIPAAGTEAGMSLGRRPDGRDTDVNGADFVHSVPSPGRKNYYTCDLRATCSHENMLPCKGSLVSVSIRLINVGLDRFSGPVTVSAAMVSGGSVYGADCVETYLELDADHEAPFELQVPAPVAQRVELHGCLASPADENPSNDTLRVALYTSPGPIIVNEIMYRPHVGGSEWIEILNTGLDGINLVGWSIADAAGSPKLISSDDLWIGSGDYLILAQYPEVFEERYPACQAVVSGVRDTWPVLNDCGGEMEAEMVALYDEAGLLVEMIVYRDMMDEERGRSIERFSEYECSSVPGNLWHRCALPTGATPGTENSTRSGRFPRNDGLTIHPNPFCPSRDRRVVITGSLREPESGFFARIFTLEGYEIIHLFGEEGGASIFSCSWDGREGNGRVVPTGLYICSVEFVMQGGVVCRREKGCIAVVGSGDSY